MNTTTPGFRHAEALTRSGLRAASREVTAADLEGLTDEELVVRARHRDGDVARRCLEVLYRRHYTRVARWCLRVCPDADSAADAAQEVFVRVHQRLDTFRLRCRFSTWLYAVTRSVAINHSSALSRRRARHRDTDNQPEPASPARPVDELAASVEIAWRLQRAIDRDLEPLEAQVLYMHHVHGLTLPAITRQLGLTNASGAKAYLVAARRKLHRRFGRWLKSQSPGGARS